MKRIRTGKVWIYLLLLSGVMVMAESCSTTKKGCGCGSDINRAYKPKRFH